MESELFGREKGAYTGAVTKMTGRFELAHGSTLFLDEIGELPLELQSKLLRVLEEGRFERLGSGRTIQVDVRLLAATNRDLTADVRESRFRKDLYYRLNVFPIQVPPLRERSEDIPALVWRFVRQFEKTLGKRIESIPKKNMESLRQYDWPGNIRELRNTVERAMIVSKDGVLDIRPPVQAGGMESLPQTLEDAERAHILTVLDRTGWRISGLGGAADVLGMKRTTLQSKMKALGIARLRR
jgi:formate hydrogenlyase transcriptional activator